MSFHFSSSYFRLLLLVLLFRLCLTKNSTNVHDGVLCMDDERQALLDFKHTLIDEANRLASWVPEKKDCCTWTGIVCNNFTGHVHSIHLRQDFRIEDYSTLEGYGEFLKQRLRGDLSPSLLYLKQLEHLDLSGNDFGGIQIPSFMGSLQNLRYLNLSCSRFGGTIPPQLGNLTELRILCLGSFYGSFINDYHISSHESTSMRNTQWLSNLRLLHHLDMSGVNLNKAIDWFEVINTLPSLVELRLSYCQLSHIHPHVASLNLTSLSFLDLSYNFFNNSFMPRWIFSLTSLVSLDLSGCDFLGPIPSGIDGFRNLTSLELLHVSGNDFMNSSLVLQGLSGIGGNLISLDISSCGVSSSVLNSLQNLTSSLLSLDLSENRLTKPIPKSLGNLCNLKHIDLGGNYFPNIGLTSLLESLFECKSPRLESLSLELAGLSCHLPHQLGQLIYLLHFQLGNNSIVGVIPDSIGRLSLLRSLDLHENLILGPIPYSIGRLSSLELLDLSSNRLNGSLPNSLGQLSKLNRLDISSNLLTGTVTEAHVARLTRLMELHGEGNRLTLRSRISNWIPSSHLVHLSLNSWDLGPQFPLWLQLHTNLMRLEMSNTRISTTIPESFWKSLPNLQHLDLSQNHIQGMLFGIHAPLVFLNLSSNKFGGQLPHQLSNNPLISIVDLSYNSFVGSLRHMLCPNSNEQQLLLRILNLGNNNLSGVIPECQVIWPNMFSLNLENNNLSGRIPRTLGALSSLESLVLCNNKLSGKLPLSLKNLWNLEILQLAGNELDGRVPAWLGRGFSNLRILDLRSNKFEGHISDELCYLTIVQILDIADNNLSGNIPKCFNKFSVLSGKEASSTDELARSFVRTHGSASLVIKGREDIYSSTLGLVRMLDLSSNNFSGIIPHELMSLRALQSLNLSRNQLTGRIPENIGGLKSLISFDVSLNRLSGELPVSLSSLSFLSSFNVSYNNLTGRVPSSTQLQSFNESGFLGNKLCGDPLTNSCAVEVPVRVPVDRDQDEEENDGTDWGLIISMVSGFIAGFWVVMAPLIVSRRWRIAYFGFLSDMRFLFYDAIRNYFCNMFHKY